MSRGLPQVIVDATEAPVIYPFLLVECDFDTTPRYYWSGLGDLVLDGKTYTGVGTLLGISDIQEGADLSAKGANVTMSGVPTNLLDDALAEDYQGRDGVIKLGIFDPGATALDELLFEDGDTFLFEDGDTMDMSYDSSTFAFTLFAGPMDQMNITAGATDSKIAVSVESRNVDLRKPRAGRYTDEDQKARYPGDLAFDQVTRLQDEVLTWA